MKSTDSIQSQKAWVQIPLPSSWPWPTNYTCLSLSFLTCKMGVAHCPPHKEGWRVTWARVYKAHRTAGYSVPGVG